MQEKMLIKPRVLMKWLLTLAFIAGVQVAAQNATAATPPVIVVQPSSPPPTRPTLPSTPQPTPEPVVIKVNQSQQASVQANGVPVADSPATRGYLFRRWHRTPFKVIGNGVGIARSIVNGTTDAKKALLNGTSDVVQLGASSLIAPVQIMLHGVVDGVQAFADANIDMYDTAKYALKQARNEYRKSRPGFIPRARRQTDDSLSAPADDKFVEAVSTLIMNPTKCNIKLQVVSCEKLDDDEAPTHESVSNKDDDGSDVDLLSLCMVEIQIEDCDGDAAGIAAAAAAKNPHHKAKRSVYSKYKLDRDVAKSALKKSRAKRTIATTSLLIPSLTHLTKWLNEHISSKFVNGLFKHGSKNNNGTVNIDQHKVESASGPAPSITAHINTTQQQQQHTAQKRSVVKSEKMFFDMDPNPPILYPFFNYPGVGNYSTGGSTNGTNPAPTAATSSPSPPPPVTPITPATEPSAAPSEAPPPSPEPETGTSPPEGRRRRRRSIPSAVLTSAEVDFNDEVWYQNVFAQALNQSEMLGKLSLQTLESLKSTVFPVFNRKTYNYTLTREVKSITTVLSRLVESTQASYNLAVHIFHEATQNPPSSLRRTEVYSRNRERLTVIENLLPVDLGRRTSYISFMVSELKRFVNHIRVVRIALERHPIKNILTLKVPLEEPKTTTTTTTTTAPTPKTTTQPPSHADYVPLQRQKVQYDDTPGSYMYFDDGIPPTRPIITYDVVDRGEPERDDYIISDAPIDYVLREPSLNLSAVPVNRLDPIKPQENPGLTTEPGEFEWHVFLKFTLDRTRHGGKAVSTLCSGALINRYTVVTIGSCVYDHTYKMLMERVTVYANLRSNPNYGKPNEPEALSLNQSFWVDATNAFVHPRYKISNHTIERNIAVLHLDEPLPLEYSVTLKHFWPYRGLSREREILISRVQPADGTLEMVGYGRSTAIGRKMFLDRRFYILDMTSANECRSIYKENVCLDGIVTAVNRYDMYSNACSVEIGAPLTLNLQPGRYGSTRSSALVGLLSFGTSSGCSGSERLSGFVSVPFNYGWIMANIK